MSCHDANARKLLPVIALGLLLGALPVCSQEPSQEVGANQDTVSPFGDIVDVELVNVEVWVTNRKGEPVTGLTAADFKVLEDGEPVEISYFTAPQLGPAPAASQAIAPVEPAVLESSGSTLKEIREVRDPGHLVIYFDETNLSLVSRQRAVEALREFIREEQLPPEKVMILRQPDDLLIAASFESGAEDLDVALANVHDSQAKGSIDEKNLELDNLQRMWDTTRGMMNPCRTFVPMAQHAVKIYGELSRRRFSETMRHLVTVSSSLASLPGVKTMIIVSDAMEFSPGDDLLEYINFRCPLQIQDDPLITLGEDISDNMRSLTRHANANRVTLYTWQAHGIRGNPLGAASTNTPRIPALGMKMNASARGGLAFLADKTGGRMLNKGQIREDLRTVVEEMTGYYSLAYVPPHGGDGKEHEITVKMPGARNVQVRHRHGYQSKGADERMRESLEGALFFGLVSNPLTARLGAGTIELNEDGRYNVPLYVFVPAEKVVFMPVEEGEKSRMLVQLVTRNTDNGDIVFNEKPFDSPRPPAGEDLTLAFDVELPEGIHVVGIALRDELSRDTSYVATTLQISGL